MHEIPVAVETPAADAGFFGLMALLGIYVGVIPVALGMLWLPWLRRVPPEWLRALMALTVGLLAFLAVDATLGRARAGGRGLAGVRRRGAGVRRRGGGVPVPGGRVELARTPRVGRLGRCSSRSASGCTTSARAWRSARRTRRARSPWARSWSSGSRSTTPPRGWRSSRRWPANGRRWASWPLLGPPRGRPGGARRLDRRRRLQRVVGGVPVRVRRGRDRAGDRHARPSLRDDSGRTLHPAAVTGILGGMALMFATGLLVAA